MEPVGDLLRRGCSLPRALRIRFRAVPHDSRHARTLPQPSGQTLGRAIGEQIDWPMGLQIDQQRAIAMPPPKGEVAASGASVAYKRRSSVSGLVGTPAATAKRAPPSPPAASAKRKSKAVASAVRRA